jgi:hypothetical protein
VAIEVHGSAHGVGFFLARGLAEREARQATTYGAIGWTVRMVTARQLADERAQTLARVREAVILPDQVDCGKLPPQGYEFTVGSRLRILPVCLTCTPRAVRN